MGVIKTIQKIIWDENVIYKGRPLKITGYNPGGVPIRGYFLVARVDEDSIRVINERGDVHDILVKTVIEGGIDIEPLGDDYEEYKGWI